jgi:helicase
MIIVFHPQKGSYRIFFIDTRRVLAIGAVDLVETHKGYRPKDYRQKAPGRRGWRNVPTKELIAQLRRAAVKITRSDSGLEAFLHDLQIPFGYIDVCRLCLIEDRINPLSAETAVKAGRERICMDCAVRELRRELGYLGGAGTLSTSHLEHMLSLYHDLDRVLGMMSPERTEPGKTLFDRIEAHEIGKTAGINELPLPAAFREASGVEHLMPVQQLAYDAGLLHGKNLLVVAATASGKTFIGEMAGIKNCMEKRGRMLFLVPLVALANQKYQRFRDRYGNMVKVSLSTGISRLNLPETRMPAERGLSTDIVVGTYEGIDHSIRCGRRLRNIGTVVIDEVQMLEDPERGHRLDGLIARLKHIAPKAQFLYLSATIGAPSLLARKLGAHLVTYESRPVPLERHLIFLERKEKIPVIRRMTEEEYRHTSSKGYRGQTIVFANSRARCHTVAEALGRGAAPYHAGLTAQERRDVENRFLKGKLAVVVTTAALAAGVDFPASQVIFDSLAMGISWLTVQEFHQMMGRAGRPDFHDLGKVVVLAEPGGTYARGMVHTEEEVAIMLLRGEMEEVAPEYGEEEASEEIIANAVVCGGDLACLNVLQDLMVGTADPVLPVLEAERLVTTGEGRIELTPLSRVMAEHFIGIERLLEIRALVKKKDNSLDIVAELSCAPPPERT